MKHSEPEFSIVIPVKNGREYIKESIESILAQTFEHFDLIVLDNCSTDGTSELIHSFQDPRVIIFPANKPLSIEENWTRILDLQLRDYLTIVGHDDVLYPDFLAEVSNMIHEDPRASLYHSHFNLIDENGVQIRACKPIPPRENADEFLYARHKRDRDSFGTGYVMRTEDYKMVGGFPAELPYLVGADDVVWYRLSKLSYKVCSPRYLFDYRYHRRSTSYSIDPLSLNHAFKIYLRLLDDAGYLRAEKNRRVAIKFLRRSFIGRYARILVELIRDPDPSRWDNYLNMKKQLLIEAQTVPFFKNNDLRLIVLESIASLPSAIQEPLIRLIELLWRIVNRR